MRLIALLSLFVPATSWAASGTFTLTITQTTPISMEPVASGPMKESMETMKKAWKVHVPAGAGFTQEIEHIGLTFDKIDVEAQVGYFDGKFLRADDLTREQTYVLAEGDLAGAELVLYRDGEVIGVYDTVDGVQVTGLVESAGIEIRKGPYEGEIEISSWSMGVGNSAIFPDGKVVSFTELEVIVPVDGLTVEEAESFGGFTYDGIGRLTSTTGG